MDSDHTKIYKRIAIIILSLAVILAGICVYFGNRTENNTATNVAENVTSKSDEQESALDEQDSIDEQESASNEQDSIDDQESTLDEQDSGLETQIAQTDILTKADADAAFNNVRYSAVQVHNGETYGGGTVWDATDSTIIIITNRHVMENAQETTYVIFYGNIAADAKLLYESEDPDVAFLSVNKADLDVDELSLIRMVNKDDDSFDKLKAEDEIFCIHSDKISKEQCEYGFGEDMVTAVGVANSYNEGLLVGTNEYIESLDAYMIYGYAYAERGMSGSGVFDIYGNYIGMLTGGTGDDEIVCVRLPDIEKAYLEARSNE